MSAEKRIGTEEARSVGEQIGKAEGEEGEGGL
jgi:hypothetical protein